MEKALSEAQRVLPLVADEEAFDQARSELTSILPDIADGFSQRAQEAKETEDKRKWLALTGQALDLVNNPAYLPTSAREGVQARVDSIQQDVSDSIFFHDVEGLSCPISEKQGDAVCIGPEAGIGPAL